MIQRADRCIQGAAEDFCAMLKKKEGVGDKKEWTDWIGR